MTEDELKELKQGIAATVNESIAVKQALAGIYKEIALAADIMARTYQNGGKAIFFGNGGSAADAQHLAGELVGRFAFDRPPLPALALNANSSVLTAIGNDYGYDQSFARQLQAHAKAGDVAVGISTSGASANVLAAAKLKKELGIRFIGLVGADPRPLAPYADVVIAVPSSITPRIQESHILIGHILCGWVEKRIFAS